MSSAPIMALCLQIWLFPKKACVIPTNVSLCLKNVPRLLR